MTFLEIWQGFCYKNYGMIKKIMDKINEILNDTSTPLGEQDRALSEVETPEVSENTEKIDPIHQLEIDLSESKDKYLRLSAEFDNFRKRTQKERFELIKSASESVILSLLPVLDDFDRALPSISDETTKSGVELIYAKLKSTLESEGLKVMETQNAVFDADLHEAIAQTPVNDENEKGKIIDEIQRGYYLGDKVIRHAKVIVGN
jgi:molecular chaperone GrpE